MIWNALEVTLPVFAVIGLGYVFAAWKGLHVESLARLTFSVTSPALIFTVLSESQLDAKQWATLVGGVSWISAGTALTVLFVKWRDREHLRGLLLPAVFWNAGNMGLPCAELAFGAAGLEAATIVFVTVGVLNATVGIWIAKGSGGGAELLRQPLFYASLAGVAVAAVGLEVRPRVIFAPIGMVAEMAIPLMLINLGIQLRTVEIRELASATLAVAVRMGGGLIWAVLFVRIFAPGELNRDVLLLSAALPPAVINIVLAQRYGTSPGVVASSIVLGTLVSLITIPSVLYLIL